MGRGKIDFSKFLEESNKQELNSTLVSPLQEILEKSNENGIITETDNINVIPEKKQNDEKLESTEYTENIQTIENEEIVEEKLTSLTNDTHIQENYPDTISLQSDLFYTDSVLNIPIKLDAKNSKLIDLGFKIDYKNPNIDKIVVNIYFSLNEFLKKRARQLGIFVQNYFNILILEYKLELDNNGIMIDNEIVSDMKSSIEPHYKRTETMPSELLQWVKAAAAAHSMNMTDFTNYILLREQKRERIEGLRPSKYHNVYDFKFKNNNEV